MTSDFLTVLYFTYFKGATKRQISGFGRPSFLRLTLNTQCHSEAVCVSVLPVCRNKAGVTQFK